MILLAAFAGSTRADMLKVPMSWCLIPTSRAYSEIVKLSTRHCGPLLRLFRCRSEGEAGLTEPLAPTAGLVRFGVNAEGRVLAAVGDAAEVATAWQRAKIFLLPADYTWPDASSMKAQKSFLREGVEMGMFPKEAADLIDGMYAP